jgi:bisphosphoglycerate-independent phosphoglycerate mutase (AlkP superfamily)/inosine/xanthosine triphosphate pyrophosphatase family protein
MSTKTKVLCIFDGFGLAPDSGNNCVSQAKMPNFRRLLSTYNWGVLDADGENVGQESGLVGNSEVGHMNIGGLKLIPQLSYQITKSAENAFEIDSDKYPDQLIDPINYFRKHDSKVVHLIGLFSKGSIHSDLRHWVGAIEAAGTSTADKIVLHILSDGRDSDKKSLVETWEYFLETYKSRLSPFENKIFLGSLGGRFYAMDRDKNWNRIQYGLYAMLNLKDFETETEFEKRLEKKLHINNYNCGFHTVITPTNFEVVSSIIKDNAENNYQKSIYDENIQPTSITQIKIHDQPFVDLQISKNDTVWLLNFRSDRMKQMTQMLCDLNQTFDLNLAILSMNDYGIDEKYKYQSVFKTRPVKNTLAETISKKNQITNVIVLHCRGGAGYLNFYKGIKDWCHIMGIEYIAPQIKPRDALADIWLSEIDAIKDSITENTVIIGHGMGALAISRYLSDHKLIIKSFHIVSGYFGNFKLGDGSEWSLHHIGATFQGQSFDQESIDFDGINDRCESIYLHYSNDDPVFNFSQIELYHAQLPKAKVQTYDSYGHFEVDSITESMEFSEIINLLTQDNQTTQLHIAETEKYAHVTYFMNGGIEAKNPGEDWVVIPSNKVASHAEMPEMKAKEVTDYILESLIRKPKILFATTNNSKIRLFKLAWIHQGLDKKYELVTLNDLSPIDLGHIEENSGSFGGDALIKAQVYAKAYNLPTISQDRGFVIDSLNWPGTDSKKVLFGDEKKVYSRENSLWIDDTADNILRAEAILAKIGDKPRDMKVVQGMAICLPDGSHAIDERNNVGYVSENINSDLDGGFGWFFVPKDLGHVLSGFNNQDEIDVYCAQNMYPVTDTILHFMDSKLSLLRESKRYDYILVNYANPDMVGHTGDIVAGIQSMEFLDIQLGRLIAQIEQGGHSLILIADHGNMEFVGEFEREGKHLTDTEHNPNPVPFIVVDANNKSLDAKDYSEKWLTAEEIANKIADQQPLWHAGKKLLEL